MNLLGGYGEIKMQNDPEDFERYESEHFKHFDPYDDAEVLAEGEEDDIE